MREIAYDRNAALSYARRWAYDRNPRYYDFDSVGGDCTNFISQCLYAGIGVMNYTKIYGWYYVSPSDRTASWTAAQYLQNFLINNTSVGPYGSSVSKDEVIPGDIIQLENSEGQAYHSLIVTKVTSDILVATHSFNALDRPLATYDYYNAYFIHINGGRTW